MGTGDRKVRVNVNKGAVISRDGKEPSEESEQQSLWGRTAKRLWNQHLDLDDIFSLCLEAGEAEP